VDFFLRLNETKSFERRLIYLFLTHLFKRHKSELNIIEDVLSADVESTVRKAKTKPGVADLSVINNKKKHLVYLLLLCSKNRSPSSFTI
jgi:hypothetical protein